MANIVDDYTPVRNKQMQQSTMSENTHHLEKMASSNSTIVMIHFQHIKKDWLIV